MTRVVVSFWRTEYKACMILASVVESKAEVASSHMRIRGFFNNTRAKATLCFSPPESFSPRSPTMVSSPLGIWATASARAACWTACCTSSEVASTFPYFTLYSMVSLNSTVSWGTTPMCLRRLATLRRLMSCPSTRICPDWTS
mmetsp:Transcript_81846/g.144458  ORF Transcript_81846/g.144458 Transcript_81846/m.144458 type:complete len:143 (-) Transcript_81846:135-563(-)